MSERRSSDRRRVLKGCRVLFNKRSSAVDCMVRNQTEEGARLHIENSHFIPDEFDLLITQTGKIYACRVVWRRGDDMGVTFTAPPEDAPPQP